MSETGFYTEIIEWIKAEKPDKGRLANKKMKLAKVHGLKNTPTDIEIFLHLKKEEVEAIRPFVVTKPMRTGSGVAVVATMTKPFNCPHGSCTFCPGGLKSFYGDVPKSYTGKEPSTMRGIRNDYDPYRIVFNRIEQYVILGQNPQKVDQIIMGGTFCAFPFRYQDEYVHDSFQAYNDFSAEFFKDGVFDIDRFKEFFELPGERDDPARSERIKNRILSLKEKNAGKTIEEEQKINEEAGIRCIGLTIETKPDWGVLKHGLKLLELGTTRVELGVQTVYDDILQKVNRGHTLEHTKQSIAELRDLGFKLNLHMMPGLPEPNGTRIEREKDIASLKAIFSEEDYRPDMLKVYPCMVMPGTELEKEFKEGTFVPLTTKEAADIIVEGMRDVPEYCRVMRVQRDIPTYQTTAGVDKTNLRQYVDQIAQERKVKFKDIRAREIRDVNLVAEPQLVVREFTASGGKEFFISYEGKDNKGEEKLLGFVRLRLPPRSLHPAITLKSALIRELHVYGTALGLGEVDSARAQHKGLGKGLMAKAEEIAREHAKDKMVVISGVGVRGYYRKLGYELEGPYMVKHLN